MMLIQRIGLLIIIIIEHFVKAFKWIGIPT